MARSAPPNDESVAGSAPVERRFDAVIFDLDGVLVDSEIWWDEVRQAFAAEHDRTWTLDDRAAVMGANSRQWSATMRERLSLDLADAAIERAIVDGVVRRYRDEGPPVIEGAVETVRRIAAGWSVAVASSAHREVIDAALSATGLTDVFKVVLSSDEVAHGKPEPDVYLEAARRLDVAPSRCLVVEDSMNGVVSGAAAGMSVILVPNRSIPPAAGAAERAHQVLEDIAMLDPERVPVEPTAIEPAPEAAPQATEAAPLAPGSPRVASPRSEIAPEIGTIRYRLARIMASALTRSIVRVRPEGLDRLPAGPAIYCFNHLNWADPFILMAALPMRPRLYFFGPKEEDMGVGGRNRIMTWSGTAVPYKPGKNDLLVATRKVDAVLRSGAVLAIAGEGRIGASESGLLPLSEGTAYFALRGGVPIVPVAISGTSWLRLGRTVRVQVGEPIPNSGRPTREAIAAATDRSRQALLALIADAPDLPVPGRFGRWLTEVFNEWPEGARPDSHGGAPPDDAGGAPPDRTGGSSPDGAGGGPPDGA